KPKQEKYARYIRGVSSYRTGHPKEALHDLNIILNDWTSKYTKNNLLTVAALYLELKEYNKAIVLLNKLKLDSEYRKHYDNDVTIILNDWTSKYTENTLLTVAALYLELKEYNEAIVHLKKLELNSEYRKHYGYAVTNLIACYFELGDMEQMAKYVKLIKEYPGASEEEIAKAYLYSGRALLQEGNKESAMKELSLAALKSQGAVGAEARYRVGQLQYENKQY